jgi:hypothetical protein
MTSSQHKTITASSTSHHKSNFSLMQLQLTIDIAHFNGTHIICYLVVVRRQSPLQLFVAFTPSHSFHKTLRAKTRRNAL